MQEKLNNIKCACGCGEDVPNATRKTNKGTYPKFIRNHWWRLPEYGEKIAKSNRKRKREIPNIHPSTGRRHRGNKYWSREIMEQSLGRKLLPTEHVHHINGDKADDRIENLIVLTKSNHRRIHNDIVPNIDLICECCGKHFVVKITYNARSKHRYCSRKCFCNAGPRKKVA